MASPKTRPSIEVVLHGFMAGQPLRILAASCWIAAAVLLAARFAGKAADDFFITYRYAQNLCAGEGFVFNPGERIFGTTEPGLGLLLALLHSTTGISLPILGTIVTALCVVILSVAVLWGMGASKSDQFGAILGGSLLVASPFVWIHQGSAAPLVVTLLALAAILEPKRPTLAGFLAGFSVWCRPDAAIGVGVLLVLAWFERRAIPRRFTICAALMILIGVACALWYFGVPLPGTLEAKREIAQRTAIPRAGISFWPSAWPLWRRTAGPLAFGVVILAVPALIALTRLGGRAARLLAWNAAAMALAYPFLGVPFMNWYALASVVAVTLGLPVLATRAAQFGRVGPPSHRIAGWPVVALAGAAILSLGIGTLRWLAHPDPPPRQELYERAAAWISQRAEERDLVAHTEVGTLAYSGRFRMLDLAGLVSPDLIPDLSRGDYRGVLKRHPARFVLVRGHQSRLARLVTSNWFAKRYTEAARWTGFRGEVLIAYERRREP